MSSTICTTRQSLSNAGHHPIDPQTKIFSTLFPTTYQVVKMIIYLTFGHHIYIACPEQFHEEPVN